MIHPHNPVMQRLGEMAKLWKQHVLPGHRMVRWMLKPEDNRMYEGFCRLEASPHGSLDNLFVFFYTPFQSAETYSHAIMEDWVREYDENTEQKKLLAATGVKGEWEVTPFRAAITARHYTKCDALLLEMIDSYRAWLGIPAYDFVLALLPKEMHSPAAFVTWLQALMEQPKWMEQPQPPSPQQPQPPAPVQLLLFDHLQGNFWGEVFERYKGHSCTLQYDLRMEQAIREIATTGAATDPQAAFRKCLFEMGEAAGKKAVSGVHEWGEKAIAIGRKSGDNNLLATAFISYAGMLFNFKEHGKIDILLEEGMQVCKKGIAGGDSNMRPLLLQYYAYKGSHCQIRKQRREALDWFLRMGDEAVQFGYFSQAVSAYYKAFIFARYKHFELEMDRAVLAAMHLSEKLSSDEIRSSEYPFLALEFIRNERYRPVSVLKEAVNGIMQEIYGTDWLNGIAELEENYTRQKVRELEQQALTES